MPKGVYDRSKVKQKRAATAGLAAAPGAIPVKRKPGRPRKNPLEAAPVQATTHRRGPKPGFKRGPKVGRTYTPRAGRKGHLSLQEQFAVLRDNILALTQLVRAGNAFDTQDIKDELLANFRALSFLRENEFSRDGNGAKAKQSTVPPPYQHVPTPPTAIPSPPSG